MKNLIRMKNRMLEASTFEANGYVIGIATAPDVLLGSVLSAVQDLSYISGDVGHVDYGYEVPNVGTRNVGQSWRIVNPSVTNWTLYQSAVSEINGATDDMIIVAGKVYILQLIAYTAAVGEVPALAEFILLDIGAVATNPV